MTRVVPALDPGKDRHARLGLALKATRVDQFAFEVGEEALGRGGVVCIADSAHRRPYPHGLATAAECQAGVLAALIAMVDHIDGFALLQRHVQRRQPQINRHLLAHRPADNTPAPDIE